MYSSLLRLVSISQCPLPTQCTNAVTVEPRTALCPSGSKYFRVKSPGGVPYGTCCRANLPGALWSGGRPVCSLSILFTTPAISVSSCPPGANMVKKGDLKVCTYSPLKTKRSPRCPDDDNYHILNTFGQDIGTCCAPDLAAVWNVSIPACSLDGVQSTHPADSILNCESDRTFHLDGLKSLRVTI